MCGKSRVSRQTHFCIVCAEIHKKTFLKRTCEMVMLSVSQTLCPHLPVGGGRKELVEMRDSLDLHEYFHLEDICWYNRLHV